MNEEIVLPQTAQIVVAWFKAQPIFGGLIALMILDIMVGTCLSIVKRTMSSTISWRGMSRKVIMLLLVGASGVLQQFIPTFPFLNVVSAFYTLTEFISILENAAAAGVPLPKGLVDALVKLREQQQVMSAQKLPAPLSNSGPTINQITINPAVPIQSDQSPSGTTTTTETKRTVITP